jgi:hypothetical protein
MGYYKNTKKGKHNTLEKYHVYKISINNLHMKDTNTDTYNLIFVSSNDKTGARLEHSPPNIKEHSWHLL